MCGGSGEGGRGGRGGVDVISPPYPCCVAGGGVKYEHWVKQGFGQLLEDQRGHS